MKETSLTNQLIFICILIVGIICITLGIILPKELLPIYEENIYNKLKQPLIFVNDSEDINKEDKEKNNINKNIDIEKKSANEEENRFIIWMQKEYPHVCKMKKPLTLDEYNKLRDLGYSSDQITSKLDVLENRDDYIRRYRSPYLCVRNWLKSDFTKVKR